MKRRRWVMMNMITLNGVMLSQPALAHGAAHGQSLFDTLAHALSSPVHWVMAMAMAMAMAFVACGLWLWVKKVCQMNAKSSIMGPAEIAHPK